MVQGGAPEWGAFLCLEAYLVKEDKMGRLGKVTSVLNLGTIVRMMVEFDEPEDGKEPFVEVLWDWRMFQSFAGAVPGVMEGDGVFAKIDWKKMQGMKVEWSQGDEGEIVLPVETADGQAIEVD